jgi:hypothetical protein
MAAGNHARWIGTPDAQDGTTVVGTRLITP